MTEFSLQCVNDDITCIVKGNRVDIVTMITAAMSQSSELAEIVTDAVKCHEKFISSQSNPIKENG